MHKMTTARGEGCLTHSIAHRDRRKRRLLYYTPLIVLLSRFRALRRFGRATVLRRRFSLIAVPMANADAERRAKGDAKANTAPLGLFDTVLDFILDFIWLCCVRQSTGRDHENRGRERHDLGDDEFMHEPLLHLSHSPHTTPTLLRSSPCPPTIVSRYPLA